MANNPQKLSNDLFRFASVRAINTHTSDALERRYISLSKDKDNATIKKNNPNNKFLFFNMNQFIESYKDYKNARLRIKLDERKKTDKLILTPEEFEEDYPHNFDSVYEWSKTASPITSSGLITQIDNALKSDGPIKNFLTSQSYQKNKFRLYETLLAYYIVPEPAYFLDVVNQRIKWFWIMQRLVSPDNDFATKFPNTPQEEAQAIKEALNATIILPFETSYPKLVEPTEGVPPTKEKEKTEREIAKERLKDLNHAEKEITEKRDVQNIDEKHAAKYCEERDKKSNPTYTGNLTKSTLLASRYVAGLSDKTHEVIDNYRIPKTEGLNTEHALERINGERKNIFKRHFPRPVSSVVIDIGSRLIEVNNPCSCESGESESCIPYKYDPCAKYPHTPVEYKKTQMRTPGWADLKVIKTTLLKYEKGEIAHIENVLKGEVKVREFNVTKRTEESLFTEEEVTSETEKETQSTDRFELEKEISQQSKEDMKFDTGVKVSAKLGPVQLDTHLNFAYTTSKEESTKTATKNAQETMNRALSKLIERKKTQRTVTTIVTTEDKNSHTLDNKVVPKSNPPTDNIHGMYFWVDKYYLAKVVNYGSRFMLEFMVPEPAAFYIYSKTNKPQPANAKVKPKFPQIQNIGGGDDFGGDYKDIKSFEEISEGNYAELASQYNAQDIALPPSEIITIATSIKYNKPSSGEHDSAEDNKDESFVEINKELIVPDGYTAWYANVVWQDFRGAGSNNPEFPWYISILVGDKHTANPMGNPRTNIPLNDEDKVIPLSAAGHTRHFVANIEVKCRLTDKKRDEWRKNTFNSIMTAYNTQLTDYENWLNAREVNSGISIQGNNPEINRQIEKEELKKHCIQLMTGQDFSSFNAVDNNVAPLGYPEINSDQAFEEGKDIQFFEQAFEWEQMTYVFYPYFWGRKPNWVMIKSLNDTDPVFTSFLQAGAARVLVPARPGFEDSVVNFLAGQETWKDPKIWTGTNPPIPGDELWISIVDELKEKQGQFEGGKVEGEPWIYKIPTSLVYLEETKFKLEGTDLSTVYPNDVQKAKSSTDFN